MSTKTFRDDLKSRLLWLITFRVVIVTLLLGVAAFIHFKEGGEVLAHSIIPIYILIGTSYLITFLSLIAMKMVRESDRFADVQIAADILLTTALVYVTGGIDSIFFLLYIFTIIWAGIVLQGRRVFLAASLSGILYGSLLELQYFKFLPQLENPLSQPQDYSDIQVLYKVFINITAFYTVAFLSRYLFVQIRRTRDSLQEAEEAVRRAEKLAVMGQLAAGMAHEIRNPLASMSGSIQMLRDELVLDQENRRLMDIIMREAERLNRLITSFLDYARPYKPEKEEVDFSNMMTETLDVFETGLSQDQRITIQRDIMPQLKVYGEKERLKEVLWNLLNNAVQSMSGEGTIKVSLKNEDDAVVAEIRDTGEGIEEKDMERVFEPFFTTKIYGSGLGLAAVYRIIEGHGGEIIVESEKGKGTLFSVRLPISIPINKDQEL